jgi:hypothetical protein
VDGAMCFSGSFGRVHATSVQGSKASVLYYILPFEVGVYHHEHIVLYFQPRFGAPWVFEGF